ncbi:hypothetical protein VCV18_011780 [Metarhizium anisopliae]
MDDDTIAGLGNDSNRFVRHHSGHWHLEVALIASLSNAVDSASKTQRFRYHIMPLAQDQRRRAFSSTAAMLEYSASSIRVIKRCELCRTLQARKLFRPFLRVFWAQQVALDQN